LRSTRLSELWPTQMPTADGYTSPQSWMSLPITALPRFDSSFFRSPTRTPPANPHEFLQRRHHYLGSLRADVGGGMCPGYPHSTSSANPRPQTKSAEPARMPDLAVGKPLPQAGAELQIERRSIVGIEGGVLHQPLDLFSGGHKGLSFYFRAISGKSAS